MTQEALLDIYTDNLISHDKITRFLNNNHFDSSDLWLYVKPTVRQIEQEVGGVLFIDDSIEEKPYTDEFLNTVRITIRTQENQGSKSNSSANDLRTSEGRKQRCSCRYRRS